MLAQEVLRFNQKLFNSDIRKIYTSHENLLFRKLIFSVQMDKIEMSTF